MGHKAKGLTWAESRVYGVLENNRGRLVRYDLFHAFDSAWKDHGYLGVLVRRIKAKLPHENIVLIRGSGYYMS